MNKVKYIVSFLLIVSGYFAKASEHGDSWMFTDREVYASGEYVLTKIFAPQEQNFKITYLVLSSTDGNLITSVKLSLNKNQTAGYLYLPDSLSTGSYLLSAYSPHFQKQNFFSKEIVVLNRFERPDQIETIRRAILPESGIENNDQIKIQGLKEQYSQRENVSVTMQLDDQFLAGLDGDVSIVVSDILPGWKARYKDVHPDFDHSILLSKASGVVMQGVVNNSKTGKPVDGATVYLTVPDSIPYFDYYKTGDDGRFYFLLKGFHGTHPVVVQAVKGEETDSLKIQLDNQFPNINTKINTQPQKLNGNTQTYLSQAISLVSFRKAYHLPELEFSKTKYHRIYSFPFYGRAAIQVYPDLYMEMDNFNEISKELLPPVRFRNHKGKYSLNVLDKDLDNFSSATPLILIDGVPVQRIERIANMGTKDIDRIDVVPYQSYYGNLQFDGILALYTKELDASRIFSSDRILKINYETIQDNYRLEPFQSNDIHYPDFRQVLLWEPDKKAGHEVSLNFKTSDVKGTFRIRITARDKNGEMIQSNFFFKVTE